MSRLAEILLLSLIAFHPVAFAESSPPWSEILRRPAQTDLPAPRPELEWLVDYDTAFRRAEAENRPLFVTLRCLPCKQCADFDKSVLEGGAELDPLLRQFVTLRITDASGPTSPGAPAPGTSGAWGRAGSFSRSCPRVSGIPPASPRDRRRSASTTPARTASTRRQ